MNDAYFSFNRTIDLLYGLSCCVNRDHITLPKIRQLLTISILYTKNNATFPKTKSLRSETAKNYLIIRI